MSQSDKIIRPGQIVGPDGEPIQPKAIAPNGNPIPWITVVFEQYPKGVFGLVQIREETTDKDGNTKVNLAKREIFEPNIRAALKKLKNLVVEKIGEPKLTSL